MKAGESASRRSSTALLAAATAWLLSACSAGKASNRVHAVTENNAIQNATTAAHYVWCSDPFGCYESAALMCASQAPDASPAPEVFGGAPDASAKAPPSSPHQHPRRENHRQVAEPGMSVPPAVRDGNEWRIMIVCDPGA
jgi:hypothetical protein